MKIFATNIGWDIDDDDDVVTSLPDEIEIPPAVYIHGLDRVSDYISDETGFCHEGFAVENKDNTALYIVTFFHISDNSRLSANIPDVECGKCILEIENRTKGITYNQIRALDIVQSLYTELDAGGISFEELPIDDYIEEYSAEINYHLKNLHYISASELTDIN